MNISKFTLPDTRPYHDADNQLFFDLIVIARMISEYFFPTPYMIC